MTAKGCSVHGADLIALQEVFHKCFGFIFFLLQKGGCMLKVHEDTHT